MDYLKIAIQAAKQAGKIHKKYFQGSFKVKTKSSSFDLLTIVDLKTEKAVTSLIRKYFPEHNFLAEENIYKKTGSEFTWVIDPLDGTSNFVSGIPVFCVSIALVRKDEVIVGVIYDVVRNELFYAQKHKGAFLNGKRIRVNSVDAFTKSLLITGFYYNRGKEVVETLEAIKRFLFKRIIGLRRFGAAALDLCFVASGRASGYWEFELNPWDFAAGKLIVEEAGGKVTGKYGEKVSPAKRSFIVASNGNIHKQLLSVIKKSYR